MADDSAFTFSSQPLNSVRVTANYTANRNDNTIEVDTSAGDVTVVLVDPGTRIAGTQIRVKKVSTDNNVMMVQTPSGTIDGVTSFMTNSSQRPSYTLESNGTNYIKV